MKNRLSYGIALALLVPAAGFAQTRREVPPPIDRYFSLVRAEFSGDRAKELVAYVGSRFRVPGNAAFDSSLNHVVSQLRAAGYELEDSTHKDRRLTYRIETRPLRGLAWDAIDGSLGIVGEKPLLSLGTNLNLLAINSYPTPDTGVVADLVDAGNGNAAAFNGLDVKGKIVLVAGTVSGAFSQAVQQRGALGVLGFRQPAFNQPDVNRNAIQFTSIPQDTVRKAWGMPISKNAYDALHERLARGPVRVRAIVKTRLFPSVERTVVAEVHGTTLPDDRFVFSAHVQEPGANDNASGVGVLAEVARVLAVLSKNGSAQPKRTITMLFGNEIAQTRNYLADDPARARRVHWGLSMDMVGEDTKKTGGTFLIEKIPDPSAVWTRGDDHHTEWGGSPMTKNRIVPHYFNDFLLDRALDQASTNGWVVRTNPYEGGSDHSPFLDAKVPGVLFWHFTDQFYHTDGDRIENVSTQTLANCGITALVSALTLTTADGQTARDIIGQVERAAVKRLDTELALSQKALAAGGKKADEEEILQTWTDYYVGAIASASDIEVGGSSTQTAAAIDGAKERIRAAGAAGLALLK